MERLELGSQFVANLEGQSWNFIVHLIFGDWNNHPESCLCLRYDPGEKLNEFVLIIYRIYDIRSLGFIRRGQDIRMVDDLCVPPNEPFCTRYKTEDGKLKVKCITCEANEL